MCFYGKKKKKEIFFPPQETLLSIPNIWELWISPMVCRGGAQHLFGYSQSWSSIQAEQRRMSQLSVRMGYSMAGRTVGIKLSRIRQVCSTISPCLTKEMFHGSHNRGSLIECVIPMNSDYIYTKKAPGNLILKKKPQSSFNCFFERPATDANTNLTATETTPRELRGSCSPLGLAHHLSRE